MCFDFGAIFKFLSQYSNPIRPLKNLQHWRLHRLSQESRSHNVCVIPFVWWMHKIMHLKLSNVSYVYIMPIAHAVNFTSDGNVRAFLVNVLACLDKAVKLNSFKNKHETFSKWHHVVFFLSTNFFIY